MGIGTLRRHYNTREVKPAPIDKTSRLEALLQAERERSAALAAELDALKATAVAPPPATSTESEPPAVQPSRGPRRGGR